MSRYGGEPVEKQTKDMRENPPTIIVGTPGRTLDLITRKYLNLDNLKFFILDECDKMLEQLGNSFYFFLYSYILRHER